MASLTYNGHKNMVRTLSVEPKGQFLASGSDDGTVKIWEIQTGYCHKTFVFGKTIITSVAWCPNTSLSLLAVAFENKVSQALKRIFTLIFKGKLTHLLCNYFGFEGSRFEL